VTRGAGRLVVFEGGEGVGKTTQITRLGDRLTATGISAERFREPGGTPLGDEIRRLLLDPASGVVSPRAEALLFMAARAQLLEQVAERVATGTVVLLDRFFLSTYAYQIAGRGLPVESVREANRLAVGETVPDLTLLLACDARSARERVSSRGGLDKIEREDAAFHDRVEAAFLAAAEPAWQARYPEVGPVVRIDADGSVDEVGRRIDAALVARWPETFSPLGESQ
jgi:dTMP kinase